MLKLGASTCCIQYLESFTTTCHGGRGSVRHLRGDFTVVHSWISTIWILWYLASCVRYAMFCCVFEFFNSLVFTFSGVNVDIRVVRNAITSIHIAGKLCSILQMCLRNCWRLKHVVISISPSSAFYIIVWFLYSALLLRITDIKRKSPAVINNFLIVYFGIVFLLGISALNFIFLTIILLLSLSSGCGQYWSSCWNRCGFTSCILSKQRTHFLASRYLILRCHFQLAFTILTF